MKLNSLASAVSISLAALALTACGGNDSNTTASTPAPAPKPIETPKPADPVDKVPPADKSNLANNTNKDISKVNSLIADFDAAKTVTVAATGYVRKADSNYERASNPTSANTSRSVLAVTGNLNEQNPYLSNYLVGAELKDGKIMGDDYLGQYVAKKAGDTKEGEKKVTSGNREVTQFKTTNDIGGEVVRQKLNNDTILRLNPQQNNDVISLLEYSQDHTKKGADQEKYSIQDVNTHHVLVAEDVLASDGKMRAGNANTLIKSSAQVNVGSSDTHGNTGLVGYSSSISGTGDQAAYSLNYGLPENDATAAFKDYAALVEADRKAYNDAKELTKKAKEALDARQGDMALQKAYNDAKAASDKLERETEYDRKHGLVGRKSYLSLTDEEREKIFVDKDKLVYNNKPTRVFGKNYKDYSSNAGRLDKATNKVKDQEANSYKNSYRAFETKNADGDLVYSTGNAFTLRDVQYGRLTANIDALSADNDENVRELYYRSFVNAGVKGTTDIYYARGTNATTLDQMKAVKEDAKGAKLEYRGHALTYGVAPNKASDKKSGYENSFGDGKQIQTLGNFVHAVYDTSANKLNGNIYNFVNTDTANPKSQYLRNDLVSFGGDVVGNTVVNGTSTYNKETGSFVGSFYGDAAQEFGGQVSSVANGYAAAKWGAVFGAQKVGSGVSNQEQNQTNNRKN